MQTLFVTKIIAEIFFLKPPKPWWGFSHSPAKPSFMNPTSGVSCYAVTKAVGIFKGFACHTTRIQWIIWGMFRSCQISVPLWHSTKQRRAVHTRELQLYSPENREGMWIKREIFQNMSLEKTAKDIDPFCHFTKDVNMLSKLKEQKESLCTPTVFLCFCYPSWTQLSKTTMNGNIHTRVTHQTLPGQVFCPQISSKFFLQNSLV